MKNRKAGWYLIPASACGIQSRFLADYGDVPIGTQGVTRFFILSFEFVFIRFRPLETRSTNSDMYIVSR